MATLLENIKSNWMIIVFIAGLIAGYTSQGIRLTNVEAETSENTTSISEINNNISTLNANVFILCKAQKLDCIEP